MKSISYLLQAALVIHILAAPAHAAATTEEIAHIAEYFGVSTEVAKAYLHEVDRTQADLTERNVSFRRVAARVDRLNSAVTETFFEIFPDANGPEESRLAFEIARDYSGLRFFLSPLLGTKRHFEMRTNVSGRMTRSLVNFRAFCPENAFYKRKDSRSPLRHGVVWASGTHVDIRHPIFKHELGHAVAALERERSGHSAKDSFFYEWTESNGMARDFRRTLVEEQAVELRELSTWAEVILEVAPERQNKGQIFPDLNAYWEILDKHQMLIALKATVNELADQRPIAFASLSGDNLKVKFKVENGTVWSNLRAHLIDFWLPLAGSPSKDDLRNPLRVAEGLKFVREFTSAKQEYVKFLAANMPLFDDPKNLRPWLRLVQSIVTIEDLMGKSGEWQKELERFKTEKFESRSQPAVCRRAAQSQSPKQKFLKTH